MADNPGGDAEWEGHEHPGGGFVVDGDFCGEDGVFSEEGAGDGGGDDDGDDHAAEGFHGEVIEEFLEDEG